MIRLKTDRLLLFPCPLYLSKVMIREASYLPTLLRTHIPKGWPSLELKVYLPYYIEQLEDDPSYLGWGVWVMLSADRKTIMGDISFKNKPVAGGETEISYHVHVDYQNAGYATEAVSALSKWAFAHEGAPHVIYAKCHNNNVASIRVMQKSGMRLMNESGPYMVWALYKKGI